MGSPVISPNSRSKRSERGMTLIELMFACTVLAVGMAGLALLFSTAAVAVKRNKVDSGATLVAKMVLEQIAAQDPSVTSTSVTLTDCYGSNWTVKTWGGTTANSSAGANANSTTTSPFYGGIDFSQDLTSVPDGYKMTYKDCGSDTNKTQGYTSYDVRWRVTTLSLDSSGAIRTRLITVGAKQSNISYKQLGTNGWSFPVNLRAIGGPLQ